MAKQRDDQQRSGGEEPRQPNPRKKPPAEEPEIVDQDELEVVEEAEALEVVEEAEVVEAGEEPPAPKGPAKPPPAPPKKAAPTQMARRSAVPTMLGRKEPDQPPGAELQPAQPGEAPPPPVKKAPATRVAGKAPAPTMLAPSEPDNLAGQEPKSPKPAKAEEKTTPPPQPAVPKLSLDEPEKPLDVAEVVEEAEAVPAEEVLDVAEEIPAAEEVLPEAQPASDIFAEDIPEAKEASGVAQPSSDIFAEEIPAEEALLEAQPASDIFAEEISEAKEASGVAAPAADIVLEKNPAAEIPDNLLDDVTAPASKQTPAAQDEDLFATESPQTPLPATPRPESPPPLKQAAADVSEPAPAEEATIVSEEVGEAKPPSGHEPTVAEFPVSGKDKTEDQTVVVGPAEQEGVSEADLFVPPEEAAELAEQAEEVSAEDLLENGEEISAADLLEEESSAIPLGEASDTANRPSGVDAIAEALESGVDLDQAEKAKPQAKGKPKSKIDKDLEDLFGDQADASGKRTPKPGKEAEAEEAAEDIFASDDEAVSVGATPKPGAKDEDSNIFSDSSGETPALDDEDIPKSPIPKSPLPQKTTKTAKATKAQKADDLDVEAEEPEEAEEELEAAPKKKGKTKAKVDDEDLEALAGFDEQEERPRGRKGAAVRKPKYMRRWVGGTLLGWILLAGAAGGLWYFAPDMLYEWMGMVPKSPNADKEFVVREKKELEKEQKAKLEREVKTQVEEALLNPVKNPALKQVEDKSKEVKTLETDVAALNAKKADLENLLNQAKIAADNLTKAIDEELGKAKFEPKDKKILEKVKEIVPLFNSARDTLAKLDKKLEGQTKKPGEEGLDLLLADLKKVGGALKDVDEVLAKAKVKDSGADGVKEILTARDKLETKRKELDDALRAASKELVDARRKAESPLVIPLSEATKTLIAFGAGAVETLQRGFDLAAREAQLAFFLAREKLIQTPEQKLDTWVKLLQDRRHQGDLDDAIREADWVTSKESKADAEARAKALLVKGLAQRNQEKYAAAKATLESAVKAGAGLKAAPWSKIASDVLAELTDPSQYYLPRAAKLLEEGNAPAAEQELNTALKIMPNDGRLLAQLCLVRLEKVRGQAKIPQDVQGKIRADAEALLADEKAGAEAAFVLGQLDEALGNIPEAEKRYRQALAKAEPKDQNRYRIALARVLLRDRPATIPNSEPEPKVDPKGKEIGRGGDGGGAQVEASTEREARLFGPPLSTYSPLHSPLCLGGDGGGAAVQPGVVDDEEDKELLERIKETLKLADELIKSGNKKDKAQGHMIKGQAMSKLGQRTEGLKEFAEGLKILLPETSSKELAVLLKEHPAFQHPSPSNKPSPFLAEQHFGKGLHLYWAKKYDKAEEEFTTAVGYFNKDARYWYFLGLARLAQKGVLKRDHAIFAFEEGARLEAANSPSPADVNASLERIQGPLRHRINEYRQKVLTTTN